MLAPAKSNPVGEVSVSAQVAKQPTIVQGVEITTQVGVVHPLLGPQEILSCRQHRNTERHEQHRRHQVGAATIVGGGRRTVVAGILRDDVDPAAVVVRLGVVDGLRGPFGKIPR